ncbi:hypothetical protein L7F22_009086 [Adiantum nelumboides]|nr:hypothetical protein [Adiantum nelumboides]
MLNFCLQLTRKLLNCKEIVPRLVLLTCRGFSAVTAKIWVKKLQSQPMADQDLHTSKSFVSSLSAWPVGQCDSSSSGLRSHVHSIQLKESMRHVYTQAKAALQQGGISSEGANCLRLASNLDNKASGVHWDSVSAIDKDLSENLADHQPSDSPKDFSEEIANQEPSPAAVLEKAANLLASYKEIAGEGPKTYLRTAEVPEQEAGPTADWETSFTLLSAARPSSSVEITEPFALSTEGNVGGSSEGSLSTVASAGSLGIVDGLHIQIQRLQARIKSQLRDSHSEEKSKGRLQQRGSRSGAVNL